MQLMESHEVAKVLDLTSNAVRVLARRGKLVPVAVTAGRGTRLFDAADVERLRVAREAEKRAKARRLRVR